MPRCVSFRMEQYRDRREECCAHIALEARFARHFLFNVRHYMPCNPISARPLPLGARTRSSFARGNWQLSLLCLASCVVLILLGKPASRGIFYLMCAIICNLILYQLGPCRSDPSYPSYPSYPQLTPVNPSYLQYWGTGVLWYCGTGVLGYWAFT